MTDLIISVCPFQNHDFDVILKDGRGHEITLSGTRKLTDDELVLLNELAPACVFTHYTREIDDV